MPTCLVLQVPLRIWHQCSTLASAHNPNKSQLAASSALLIPQVVKASALCTANSSSHNSLLSKLREQLQQSGFLEHLPALLTDAALQLQAAAGIWCRTSYPEHLSESAQCVSTWSGAL